MTPCQNDMIRTLEFLESDYTIKLYLKKGLNNLNIAMQKRFPLALIVICGSHTRTANRKLTFSTPLSLQAMQWSQSVFEVGFVCFKDVLYFRK